MIFKKDKWKTVGGVQTNDYREGKEGTSKKHLFIWIGNTPRKTHINKQTRAHTSESYNQYLRLKLSDASCIWVFWGCFSNVLVFFETFMCQSTHGCPETATISRNAEEVFFFANELIMQPSFLMFWFSSYPLFFEFHDFSRSQCSNERTVALKTTASAWKTQ